MTTTVVFENATIQDVISKAVKIAPTKGTAFDKAAGLMIEVNTEYQEVTVRTTNLDVYYMEVLDAVEMSGPNAKWLLPSDVIGAFAAKLPIGSGKTVELKQDGGYLGLKTGRTRAKIHLIINSYYPEWDAFDPDSLTQVSKFGDLLELVAWAAEKGGNPPLNGLCLDGEYVMASDRFKLARAPLKINGLEGSITIPPSITKVLSKHFSDVEVGVKGGALLVMPDESTQIKAILFDSQFPNLNKLFTADEPDVVKFRKAAMIEILDRAMVMSGRDRLPSLRMYLTQERIAVLMVDEHAGQLGDVIDVPGYCLHDQHQIIFNPRMVLDAVQKSPNDDMTMHYDRTDPLSKVRLDGGSGYEVIIVPRRDLTAIKEPGSGD